MLGGGGDKAQAWCGALMYWRHHREQASMIHPASRDSKAWGRVRGRTVVVMSTIPRHGEALVLVFDVVNCFGR